jgi:O-antigen/teichoic acid export membrane protein
MGYLKVSIKGVSWVALLRAVTRILSFGKIAIIARLLSPLQFGLFGIASIVLAFIEIVTETGINVFLIQENEKEVGEYINTAWMISIIRGFVVFLIIIISSPFIVSFFNAQGSLGLILLISLVPLVRGFINPSVALLQKELQFKKEFYIKSCIFALDAVVSVTLVYLLKSPTGIIYGLLVGGIAEVILSFIIVYPRPSFDFKLSHTQKILHRGKWVTMSGVFNYLYHNIDDVLVGKIIGISS